MARAARPRTASTFLCVAAWITLLAALMSGCGSAEEDTFEVHYVTPSWSPDGKSIAFVASNELHVTGLGGRTTVHTDHGSRQEVVVDPTWSPDGAKIAYDVCEQSQVNPYCFVSHTVVRDVGSGRSVTFNQNAEAVGSCHVWSPDGKRIALLTTRGGTTYLNVSNGDGSGLEQLTKAADSATSCPAWSPDSRSIAYACCGIESDVHLIDAGGRNKRRLTHGMYASDISWSPDGEQIAFHSVGDDGQGHLSIRPDGTARRSIAPDATNLAWSPDSRRIAYLGGSEQDELFVADRDGRNRHLVAHEVCCPSWSPDGERLAIVKDDPDGTAAIYVIDADGKRPVKVSSPPEAGSS